MKILSIILVALSLGWAGSAVAQSRDDAAAVRGALEAVGDKDWALAARRADPAGPLATDIVEWHRLRQGGVAPFEDYLSFLERRLDWPGLPLLKRRGEGSIPSGFNAEDVVAYFEGVPPSTGTGAVRLTEALGTLGRDSEAQAVAVEAWRTRPLSPGTEVELLAKYDWLLEPHHEARMEELLWQNQWAAARRMFPLVSDGWVKLAEAREALIKQEAGVDGRISAVPEALRDHAVLSHARFEWRVRKGRVPDAIELLLEASASPESLGKPEEWANRRRSLARRMMRAGDSETAYRLASQHFLLEGRHFADLEWLSGFLALSDLEDPELALLHFERFETAVVTPISLGRAGYWQGRALTDLGAEEEARAAYTRGAEHQSSYYGLLAAEAAGLPIDPSFAQLETFPPIAKTSFAESSVLEAGLLILTAGDRILAERFLTHLTESLSRDEAGALAQEMLARGETHIALMIAKRAARFGIVLPEAYFPLFEPLAGTLPVDTDLALAITRRESEFDPRVVSPAGARGLMQVMPRTAQEVSRDLGLSYSRAALTSDPDYNIRLGTAYLAGLIETFGPAPVLVSVGYNAGPSRAVNWVSERGDPRSAGLDIIDWIEHIPFRETRNYAMRVAESYYVYKARRGELSDGPPAFTEFLRSGP